MNRLGVLAALAGGLLLLGCPGPGAGPDPVHSVPADPVEPPPERTLPLDAAAGSPRVSPSLPRLRVPPVPTARPLGEDVSGTRFEHADWDTLLRESRAVDGQFDPRPMRRNLELLDAYLDRLSRVDLDALARHEQAALLLNAWNAHICRRVVSALDDPEALSPQWLAALPDAEVLVARHVITLAELEHRLLRSDFADPRLCTALFRGTRGGPGLPSAAFTGATLDRLLDDTAHQYLQREWRAHPGSVSRYLYRYRYDIAREEPLPEILGRWLAGPDADAGSPLQVVVWRRYDWTPALATSGQGL